jgi:hypothetical protein
MSFSLFIVLWACVAVAFVALAIRNPDNQKMILAELLGLIFLWPFLLLFQLKSYSRKALDCVIWSRKP